MDSKITFKSFNSPEANEFGVLFNIACSRNYESKTEKIERKGLRNITVEYGLCFPWLATIDTQGNHHVFLSEPLMMPDPNRFQFLEIEEEYDSLIDLGEIMELAKIDTKRYFRDQISTHEEEKEHLSDTIDDHFMFSRKLYSKAPCFLTEYISVGMDREYSKELLIPTYLKECIIDHVFHPNLIKICELAAKFKIKDDDTQVYDLRLNIDHKHL